MNKLWWVLGGIILLAVFGFAFNALRGGASLNSSPSPAPQAASTSAPTEEPSPSTEASEAGTLTVNLAAQNRSGQNGTATLTEENGKVMVTMSLTGTSSTASAQPAHIHAGKCPDVGEVVNALTSLVNGKSTTTLNTTLSALKAKAPLAINVHKSVSEISTYTACGDIKF